VAEKLGAGEGNRTLVVSLGSWWGALFLNDLSRRIIPILHKLARFVGMTQAGGMAGARTIYDAYGPPVPRVARPTEGPIEPTLWEQLAAVDPVVWITLAGIAIFAAGIWLGRRTAKAPPDRSDGAP
jgi:hypothetical protein